MAEAVLVPTGRARGRGGAARELRAARVPAARHPTWTIAVMERGAAAFQVDARHERADDGECFVLEPEAVHTGVPAVPEGWAYKVLYLEPELLSAWDERDGAAPRAARWVVFRDPRCAPRCSTRTRRSRRAGRAGPRRGRPARGRRAQAPPAARARTAARPGRARRGPQRASPTCATTGTSRSRSRSSRRSRASAGSSSCGGSHQVGLPPHAFQVDLRVLRARELLTPAGRPRRSPWRAGSPTRRT